MVVGATVVVGAAVVVGATVVVGVAVVVGATVVVGVAVVVGATVVVGVAVVVGATVVVGVAVVVDGVAVSVLSPQPTVNSARATTPVRTLFTFRVCHTSPEGEGWARNNPLGAGSPNRPEDWVTQSVSSFITVNP